MIKAEQVKRFVTGEPEEIDVVLQEPILETLADARKEELLSQRISVVVKDAQGFSSNENFWNRLLKLIENARIGISKNDWITAEQNVIRAEVLVRRAMNSHDLKPMRIRLAMVPALWLVLLFLIERLVDYLRVIYPSMYLPGGESFQYIWVGMFGGTTIVWWGLVKHAKDLTFDRAFAFWYLLKPPLGAIMGIIVVLAVKAGFFAIQGNTDIRYDIPLLVLAFLGGFSERFFVQLIDRVISAIFGGEASATTPKSGSTISDES